MPTSGPLVGPLAGAIWPEVAAAARSVLVVPLGSCEQHGPHLPLDTDLRIAEAVVARACATRPGAVAAPGVPFGASGEHAAFPGTLSVGTEALTAYLIELGRGAADHWGALVLANAHGGNAEAVTAAVDRLTYEGRRCVAWHAAVRGADAHAGRTETSLMMAVAPEVVRTDRAAPGDTRPTAELMPLLRRSGVRAVSPNGVLGDPTSASAAEGERLLAALTRSLGAVLDGLLAG